MTGNFEGTQNWKFLSQNMRSIALTPDRSKAYKIRRQSGTDDQWISADPFSVAALGDPAQNPYALTNTEGSGNFTPPVEPGSFVVAPNNLDLFVAGKTTGDRAIYHHQMSVAGDASTATSQGQVLDLSSKFATFIYGIFYTPDGSKLFVLGDDGGTLKIAQYDLSPAYDVTSAVDASKEITVTPAHFAQVSSNLSISVWEDPAGGFKLYLTYHDADNFNNTAMEFDVYEAPAPTDEFFDDVVLLLDFAGADGATDITDLSNSAKVETFNGAAEVDTAIQMIGENTILYPDNQQATVSYANNPDFDFDGDFTLECFEQLSDFSNHSTQIGTWKSGAPNTGYFMRVVSGGNAYTFNSDAIAHFNESFAFVLNTTYHIAVCRTGTDLRLFVDGTQLGSTVTYGAAINGSVDELTLGALRVSGAGSASMEGSIGAVRITKGVGRYTANFTPPTVFYPTS
jgi:hypothetical protein